MDVDGLLAKVIGQAKAVGIPVSGGICPQVKLNRRAVGRFGCCVRRGLIHYIEVSARLLEAGEEPVLETLAHEVLHTCWGCRNHGERWKSYAARMNARYGYRIARATTWERMGLPEQKPARYLLVCQRCGAEIPRAKASALVQHPERYRCRCGGVLERRR